MCKNSKFSLEQAMKGQMELKYSNALSLNTALDGEGWSTPPPASFPRE